MISLISRQLIKAAQFNQLDELKNLLSQGADIRDDDDAALRWAAFHGHLEIVKFLVTQGANIHANEDRALRWSASYGHLEIVKFLIEQGANIHADDDGALGRAAIQGHLEIVKILLVPEVGFMAIAHGANIHANNDEVLRAAIEDKNEPILMLLNTFLNEEKLLVAALGSMPQKLANGINVKENNRPITKAKRSKI